MLDLPGLYVHVPFCRSKCAYCDFYSVPSAAMVPGWLRAADTEASLYATNCGSRSPASTLAAAGGQQLPEERQPWSLFDTLYIGGGTPTGLGEQGLRQLVGSLRQHFRFSEDAEFTVEANPNDVTIAGMAQFREIGVNRVSLGVQSLDDDHLRFLGRIHTARDCLRAVEAVRLAGIRNLGIDLIFGLPGQTRREWQDMLAGCLTLEPEHISCYQLTLARGTPLWASMAAGRFQLPGEEDQRSLFLAASEYLEAHGYIHYEVSNFAKRKATAGSPSRGRPSSEPVGVKDRRRELEESAALALSTCSGPAAVGDEGQHQSAKICDRNEQRGIRSSPLARGSVQSSFSSICACRHNLKYWSRAPYLGLGPSAHSFHDRRRWWNCRSVRDYCEALGRQELPVSGGETLSREEERLEKTSLAWRTRAGLPLAELGATPEARSAISMLTKHRLARKSGERLIPTARGYLVADRIPLFLP